MAQCENCGNEYANSFRVTIAGKEHVFDSFECAIRVLAPECQHCGTRIIGHGVQADNKIFCCVHCAEKQGVHGLRDHA